MVELFQLKEENVLPTVTPVLPIQKDPDNFGEAFN